MSLIPAAVSHFLIDRMCSFRSYEHVTSLRHHMNKKVGICFASSPFLSHAQPLCSPKMGEGDRKLCHGKIPT
jgi:hypothetical protein